MPTRVVHQDAAHHACGDREELDAVLPPVRGGDPRAARRPHGRELWVSTNDRRARHRDAGARPAAGPRTRPPSVGCLRPDLPCPTPRAMRSRHPGPCIASRPECTTAKLVRDRQSVRGGDERSAQNRPIPVVRAQPAKRPTTRGGRLLRAPVVDAPEAVRTAGRSYLLTNAVGPRGFEGVSHGSISTPGFSRQPGSSQRFAARIASSVAASYCTARNGFLIRPMPCSAETHPPRATSACANSA